MLCFPFSEEEVVDEVVEVVCRIPPIECAHRQCGDPVRNRTIRVSVYDRYRIPFGVLVWDIVSELRSSSIQGIDNAWILHLCSSRRLKIYVIRNSLEESLQLKALAHCTPPQAAESGGDAEPPRWRLSS